MMETKEVNGILNILKPPGMTSFDVVGYLRGILKTKKIGHTGTLDPGAAGVLPVCIGNATRAIEYMTDRDKLYRAEMTLGITTDTQDSYGELLESKSADVSDAQIRSVMESFIGSYSQIPPMYSAIKVGGKKLYELARSGITIEREPRVVEIYSMKIIKIDKCQSSGPEQESTVNECRSPIVHSPLPVVKVLFDVSCSKGTYIRTLCADIGEKLGCGGLMSFLVRLKAGIFNIDKAVTLEDIADKAAEGALDELITMVDEVFKEIPVIKLDSSNEKKFLNGVFVKAGTDYKVGELLRVHDEHDNFFALGEVLLKDNILYLKSKRLFL